jgi:Putative beta-barrel porin-2, OmpL-like. bbp2
MKKATLLLSASVMSLSLAAQDSTKTEAKASPFTFTGYIDSYYNYNTNNPLSGNNLGQSGTARAFDQKANTMGLGLVQTKFGYSHKKSDVVVDLTFGPNADLGNYGNLVGPLGTTTALAIKQAYFNFKATDKLTFTAGQFGTHIGYEVIDAPINYNYSLSNLFNNGPFYHIGLKANYAFTDKVSLMAGVVNNVDALYDNNKKKGIIGQLFLKPTENWSVYINYIGSNETSTKKVGSTKDTAGFYQVIDLTTGYQITKKFYIGINAAYGSQKGEYQGGANVQPVNGTDTTRTWGGAALYTNYAFTDKFGLGVRAEMFDNTSGVRGLRNPNAIASNGGTDVTSITVTGNITLDEGHLILKPEFRMDAFKKLDYDGSVATGTGLGAAGDIQQFQDSKGFWTKSSQATIGLALIYKY